MTLRLRILSCGNHRVLLICPCGVIFDINMSDCPLAMKEAHLCISVSSVSWPPGDPRPVPDQAVSPHQAPGTRRHPTGIKIKLGRSGDWWLGTGPGTAASGPAHWSHFCLSVFTADANEGSRRFWKRSPYHIWDTIKALGKQALTRGK